MRRMMIRFFGWLFMTEAYIATLSEDELARKALGEKMFRVRQMGRYLDGTLPERIH